MTSATSSAERTASGRGSSGGARSRRSGTSSSSSTRTQRRSSRTTSSRTRAQSSGSSSAQRTSSTSAAQPAAAHGTTVNLPFVTAEFHRPDVQLPGRRQLASAADAVRAQLPDTKHALFYGGLAAGTVLSLIEWPVALAIGVGTAVVSGGRDRS